MALVDLAKSAPESGAKPIVWSIAGNDSGGGAGLSADARAAEAFGVPRARVELLHGAAGRGKVLGITLESAAALRQAQAQVARWMQSAAR